MCDLTALTHHHGSARPARASREIARFLSISPIIRGIRTALARRARRRELRALVEQSDQHLLRDIGLTREQAGREADKWPWQA